MSAFTNALNVSLTALRRAGLFSIAIFALIIYLTPAARAQSALDGFNPGANSIVYAVAVQPDGKIIIGGIFTSVTPSNSLTTVPRNRIARFNPDGSLDASFDPNADFTVDTIVIQPDGKILVGGFFDNIGGLPRSSIARLNADGSADSSFANPNLNGEVYSIAVQTDGSILAGGTFTLAGGTSRNRIARFDTNGTLDMNFDPNVNYVNTATAVRAIAIQSNGKILIGGSFTTLTPNGGAAVTRNNIARLNTDGTVDTTFNSNAITGGVFAIAVQADGKILAGGNFTIVNGSARDYIARLNTDGSVDTTFNSPVGGNVRSIVIQTDGKILVGGAGFVIRLSMADGTADSFNVAAGGIVFAVAVQPDGKVLAGGSFTTFGGQTRNRIARLERDGRVDQTLNISAVGNFVYATAIQPDGKIIIGGDFTSVQGVTRNRIVRLNTDGTLDAIFDPNASDYVRSIAVQSDGKILVGGDFTTIGGQTRNHIARLNTDGTVDMTFDPNADASVDLIAVQSDGMILIGGIFTSVAPNGGAAVTRNRIARLNTDGTLDATFDPNADGAVSAIAVQSDGKILVGGFFSNLSPNGGAAVTRNRIARLNTNGTLDTMFDPNASSNVSSIAVQSNGNILIGGNFNTLSPNGGASVSRRRIARLNTDGTVDAAFDPSASNTVYSIAVQSDGKVLIGGVFNTLTPNGGAIVTRHHIARLDATTGAPDSFDPNADFNVYSIAIQSDGKILAGGDFTSIGGQTRNLFARLSNDTAAFSTLTVTKTSVTLTRDGSAAQFSRVVFEQSTDNGATYTALGTATNSRPAPAVREIGKASGGRFLSAPAAPTASGYNLTGLNLPSGQNILIRARGFFRSGYQNGSQTIEDKVQIAFFAPAAPTAATVSISGRALTSTGRGIRNVMIRLTDGNGNVKWATTTAFGYYRFNDVNAGETYVVTAKGKRFEFSQPTQVLNVNENASDVNFVAR